MLNVVAIMGRLVRDPELKTTQQGTSVCSFTIACDRNFAQKGEERKADFITVTAWRQTAEFVCKYFSKGSLIAVEGSLQTRQYQDKSGSNRTAVEVVANHVSFTGAKSAPQKPPRQMGFASQRQLEEWQTAEAVPATAEAPDDFAVITDDEDLPF